MEIKTKYNFGQRVQAIVQGQEQYSEICALCDGTGKVQVKTEVTNCFANGCYGNGYIRRNKASAWYIPNDADAFNWSNFVIQKIGVELYNPNNKKYSDKRSWIYYMSDSNGTMWDENNIFASEEDAQRECDIRNNMPINLIN